VPSGVDVERFAESGVRLLAEGHLLYTGAMDLKRNVEAVTWFHAHVLPEVRYAIPGLPFYVVGRSPPEAVRALAARDVATVVSGTVADVRPYLAGALALVVPVREMVGPRVGVLEAFAARVPVVSTRAGMTGIEALPDRDYLPAETVRDFAAQIHRLSTDRPLRARLTAAAYELARARYGWEAIAESLARFYEAAPPRTVRA
jgi:glycosyltransferase involved in cell wall biosynthesis